MSSVRVRAWSTALTAVSVDIPAETYLSALVALRALSARKQLVRLLQHDPQDAATSIARFGVPQPVANMVVALAAADPTLGSLPAILDATIDQAYMAKRGTALRIEVPRPLGAAAVRDLVAQLERTLPAPVVIDQQVVPRLIGGARLIVGSQRIDRSAETRLAELRHAVQAQGAL